jgi:hypothetical protein
VPALCYPRSQNRDLGHPAHFNALKCGLDSLQSREVSGVPAFSMATSPQTRYTWARFRRRVCNSLKALQAAQKLGDAACRIGSKRCSLPRLAALLVGTALLMPLLTPIAFMTSGDTHVTCCCKGECHCRYCRRHHHGAAQANSAPAFDSPASHCPCGPDSVVPPAPVQYALADVQLICAEITAHPAGVRQAQARQRLTSIRVRQKRGPPTLSSLGL